MANESSTLTTLEATGQWAAESNLTGSHSDNCATEITADHVSGEYSMSFSAVDGTIDGIEVMLHCVCGDSNDYIDIELYDSTSTWRNKSSGPLNYPYSTCGDCGDKTVGTPTDTWGGTWTAAHIKSSSFRLRLTARAAGKAGAGWGADYASVTVYYTAGDGAKVMVVQMT